jgi:hypothetical protein
LPVVLARIFNDAGDDGTTGFFEELLDPEVAALTVGKTAVLLAPADVIQGRLNVGIRTLDEGATVEITLKTANGATLKTLTRSYAANLFEQKTAAEFLDYPAGVLSNDVILIKVTSGSAIVYGATTDNTTNDPAVQFGKAVN